MPKPINNDQPSNFELAVRQVAAKPLAHPRREFKARGSFVVRCDACRMPRAYCICAYRVAVASQAVFWILMHPNEANKPTNTARLIGDVLPETQVFAWDRINAPEGLVELLQDPTYQPMLIFPDDQPDYAHRVVNFDVMRSAQPERRPAFILLDGTWRQARRMFRKSAWLPELPILPIHSQTTTAYNLRKPASSSHLCTAEVGVELLRMAQDEQAAEVLSQYFRVFNEGYAAARHQQESPELASARLDLLRLKQTLNF